MSVSKEERERYRSWLPTMPMFEAEVLKGLLDSLDGADERITELQAEIERLKIPKGMYERKCAEFAQSINKAHERMADLQRENRRLIEDTAREGHDTEAELAPALGYEYHEEYGWVTADHTVVTLAMKARRRMGELEAALTEVGEIIADNKHSDAALATELLQRWPLIEGET